MAQRAHHMRMLRRVRHCDLCVAKPSKQFFSENGFIYLYLA
jgi:hypothetical protein